MFMPTSALVKQRHREGTHTTSARPLPLSTQEKYLGSQNASLGHGERSLSQLSCTNPRT